MYRRLSRTDDDRLGVLCVYCTFGKNVNRHSLDEWRLITKQRQPEIVSELFIIISYEHVYAGIRMEAFRAALLKNLDDKNNIF